MEQALLIINAIRVAESVTQLITNYLSTASTDQIKALVAAAHARGETIDLAAVDSVIAGMTQARTDLDAKIAAAEAAGG